MPGRVSESRQVKGVHDVHRGDAEVEQRFSVLPPVSVAAMYRSHVAYIRANTRNALVYTIITRTASSLSVHCTGKCRPHHSLYRTMVCGACAAWTAQA